MLATYQSVTAVLLSSHRTDITLYRGIRTHCKIAIKYRRTENARVLIIDACATQPKGFSNTKV